MAMTRPVIAGNWKMHHDAAAARAFFAELLPELPAGADLTLAVFPPALSFAAAADAVGARPDVLLGVQNIHWEASGAFTGELSAPMAAAAGARLALVGHSERRQLFGETSRQTALKVRAALDAGLAPLLCVGETLEQREAGAAEQVVREQLAAVYDGLSPEGAARLLIAYEPVWAIGTGRTAEPSDAAGMHRSIRRFLEQRCGGEIAGATPVLYGGSVKPDNARDLLSAGDVDGVLVGGASLNAATFVEIARAAS
jgi:triosephosphate isomerase